MKLVPISQAPRLPLFALTVPRPLLPLREREPQDEELFQLPPASKAIDQPPNFFAAIYQATIILGFKGSQAPRPP